MLKYKQSYEINCFLLKDHIIALRGITLFLVTFFTPDRKEINKNP